MAVAATTLSAIQPAKAEDGAGTPVKTVIAIAKLNTMLDIKKAMPTDLLQVIKQVMKHTAKQDITKPKIGVKSVAEGTKVGKNHAKTYH